MSRACILLGACVFATSLLFVPAPTVAHEGHDERPHDPGPGVWFEEVVTDPQSDRTGEGSVTSSDEYVVLVNLGDAAVDLTGWTLEMNDSTPETQTLDGAIPAGARHVLHNPDGQMNNDVHLVLRDADGAARDEVELGSGGLPDGNAGDVLDEAVHLVGPWTAVRAPATNGTGLPSFWVESIVRAHAPPAAPFGVLWLAAGEARTDVRLHVAPGVSVDAASIEVAGVPVNLTKVSGTLWRSTAFEVDEDAAGALSITANGTTVQRFPGRDRLMLQVDATPPDAAADGVVANGTRHIRWLPVPSDPESGIATWNVTAFNATDQWRLDGCTDPAGPSSTCRLPVDNLSIRIEAENGAGGNATFERLVHNDTVAPTAPDAWFETGTPPTWRWSPFDEPLKALDVEVADDVTGVYPRGAYPVDVAATVFLDEDWVPGDPAAYRLVARDRADHVTQTPWAPLPPEAVPVEWAFDDDPAERVETLVRGGTVAVRVTFDRTVVEAPTLVLDVSSPRPARLSEAGTLDAAGDAAHFTFEALDTFPASGRGTWHLTGGRAADEAPMSTAAVAVAWDTEPPRLDAVGVEPGWVRAVRHTVSLHATDVIDPEAEVDLDRTGKGILVRKDGAGRKVTFTKEGEYGLTGAVRDASGNARAFVVTVALDGTPPTTALAAPPPEIWSGAAPIRLRVTDDTSGVNRTSLQAWVLGNASGAEARIAEWDGDVAHLVPVGGAVQGPLRVHAAVADAAGNLAEGLVAADVAPTRTGVGAEPVTLGGVRDAASPEPSGPGWLVPGTPSAAPGVASGDGASGGTAAAADAATRSVPDDAVAGTGGRTLDWVVLAIVGAGGSIGLGTAIRRKGPTGRRSSCPTPDGTRTRGTRRSRSPIGRPPGSTGMR